jgi:hypothetical protein
VISKVRSEQRAAKGCVRYRTAERHVSDCQLWARYGACIGRDREESKERAYFQVNQYGALAECY